jgi:hypothetical protein
LAAVALFGGAALVGCAAADGAAGDPTTSVAPLLVAYIDSLFEDPDGMTDFQRDILLRARQTGAVSEADWKEANNLTVACLQERGFPTEVSYEGAETIFQTFPDPQQTDEQRAQMRAAITDCSKLSVQVNSLYRYIYGDPANQDPNHVPRAIYDCLIEADLIPESTAYEEFFADFSSQGGTESGSGEGETSLYGPDRGPGFQECWDKAIK